MGTSVKKIHLKGFHPLAERLRRMKRTRPEIHAQLKNPGPRVSLACNVMDYRRKRGLSQAALAERAGVSNRTVQYLEGLDHGYNPTLDIVGKVADALGVEVSELLRRVDLTRIRS